MNNLIKTSNNELEILKVQGPYRINNTDNSDFNNAIWNETQYNEPIIIGVDELEKMHYEEKADEMKANELIMNMYKK